VSDHSDRAGASVTILDRIGLEAPLLRGDVALQSSVERDLERYLNARRPPWPIPARLESVGRAVEVQGLPDLASIGLSHPDGRAAFCRGLKESLGLAEPRFARAPMVAEVRDGGGRGRQTLAEGVLAIEITPTIRFDHGPRRVRYLSRIQDIAVGHFEVEKRGVS